MELYCSTRLTTRPSQHDSGANNVPDVSGKGPQLGLASPGLTIVTTSSLDREMTESPHKGTSFILAGPTGASAPMFGSAPLAMTSSDVLFLVPMPMK